MLSDGPPSRRRPAVSRRRRAWRRPIQVAAALVVVACLAGSQGLPAAAQVLTGIGSGGVLASHDAAPPSGYWLLGDDGGVFSYGAARFYGSMGGQTLNRPTVCMASTVTGQGYWLVAQDGGIFSFGGASFYGSTGGLTLVKPVVGMAATPDGGGYWLVATDGGVFSFGDAAFYGSTGGMALNQPVVGMASTPDGKGYWLVASDGGTFSFGDAAFYGSTGALTLNKPVVGMAATPDGKGYWLVATDGGIFSFGDAPFLGSAGGLPLAQPVVGMSTTASGRGYWLAAQDGGIFTYGDAPFLGSLAGSPHVASVAAISGVGRPGGCQGTVVPNNLPVPGGGGPPGEGQWVPASRNVGPTPAVYTTTLRPYPGGSPAGIAWMDMSRSSLRLYAGPPSQPAGNYLYSGQVVPSDRSRLLDAFNSGFLMADTVGGWYSGGQMPLPLRNGTASLVIYNNGKVQIGAWGSEVGMSPAVYSVRQNLGMLVDGGRPAADLSVGAWGAVLGGVGGNWRSGIGTDRFGNLIYVGGANLLPADLAHLLLVAGAVEGMELDINPQWVTLSTYFTAPGQTNPAVVAGQNLIPGMYYGPNRFISYSERDFLALVSS
ncbi:MAG TPA: hypothetical protein VHU85_14035 [Acidimicrobiales bacterium]|nr:hypothetical protein [Acidimicrobiales bacterium]